jgi:hypothetical protein
MQMRTVTITYTDGGARETVGLIDLDDDPARLVRASEESVPSSCALAILRGDKIQSHLVYQLPETILRRARWEPGDDTRIMDAFQQITSGKTHQQEHFEVWCNVIVPHMAFIIQGLFCPDGRWYTCPTYWLRAAATLVRSRLSWYTSTEPPHNRRQQVNYLMLWRLYAHSLLQLEHLRLADPSQRWSDDQTDEMERALTEWLTICQSDATTWLFYRQRSYWHDPDPLDGAPQFGLAYREYRREYEVRRIAEAMETLVAWCMPQPAHAEGVKDTERMLRQYLEQLGLTWYLPRYRVRDGRHAIAVGRGYTHWYQRWVAPPLGFSRLLAGILVGFFVFVLEDGVWRIADEIAGDPWRLTVSLIVPAGITWIYLFSGIKRKVAYDSSKRTFLLWGVGQVGAIGVAVMFRWLLQPVLTWSTPTHAWIAPLILAQFALFIGIFTQLLFDEKPTTAPLDAP